MQSPVEELRESRDLLFREFSSAKIERSFQKRYTEIMDQYFRRRLEESVTGQKLFQSKKPFALVALGGYGRKELCFHSDVDIMILFESKIPTAAKALADDFFLPLWDLGLDLGYGVRNIKDCLSLGREEFEVLTSILDARFIGGDSPLYLSMMESTRQKVVKKKLTSFGRWLLDMDKIRMDQFGDASYQLEPQIKEGIGGLRDYHHILWLSKAFFEVNVPRDLEYNGKLSQAEFQELSENIDFILLIRNHLHNLSKRKNDRLYFEYQEEIAHQLGFKQTRNSSAVETFLGRLHAAIASNKSLHRYILKSILPQKPLTKKKNLFNFNGFPLDFKDDAIHLTSATSILSNPSILIVLFEKSACMGLSLSRETLRLVREFLYLIDDDFRGSKGPVQSFLNMLKQEHTSQALDQMFDSGFLDVFIPEFGRVKDKVQFDAYHVYPVGRHSIEAVKALRGLYNQNDLLLQEIYLDLKEPLSLILATLFHDLGKIGKGHAKRGVAIARKILKRFDINEDMTKDILFLIENHLLLAETATRRDLNDEKIILQCADKIGSVERLKMLYLLTWADSQATGPRAWNSWISNLIQELFFKIVHVLEKGELVSPEKSQIIKRKRTHIYKALQEMITSEELDIYFDRMSPRYLLNTPGEIIVDHLKTVLALEKQWKGKTPTAFKLCMRKGVLEPFWIADFIASDRPGLFSDLAGVFALNNINIYSANLYTWRDGTVVDILHISDPIDPEFPDNTWRKVNNDIENVFSGKLFLPYRLSRKSSPSILTSYQGPKRTSEVRVDNHSSDFFTLIEVFADDRIGLLYRITRSLFEMKLDIRVAKISTKAGQVADIFYVRDLEGQKLEDKVQIEEVRRAILYELKD